MENEANGVKVSGRAKWAPLALLILTMAVYLPTVSKDTVITDNQAAAASAWRIADTGRPWMEDVDTHELEGSAFPDMWLVETADGHVVHNRTPGVILAGVPFYWALNNETDARDFRIWVGGVAAASFTAAAGVLLFLALRSRFGGHTAFVVAGAFLLATPVWSVSANALWTHNLTLFGIAGAILAATRSRWWLMGAFFAVGIFARPHLAVVAAVVGLYLAWRRRDWRIAVSSGLTSGTGLGMLVLWNRIIFGSWSVSGGYGDYVTSNIVGGAGGSLMYSIANIIGFLLAPDRGLLTWTPVIMVLIPSLLASWRMMPDWVRAFVIAGALYSLVQLRINSFQGGQNFYGYRLALEMLVCLVPALVFAFKQTSSATRIVIGGLLGLQFAAIAIGAVSEQYYVTGGDMWTTSAYVVALQAHPVALISFSVACVLIGGGLASLALKRSQTERVAVLA